MRRFLSFFFIFFLAGISCAGASQPLTEAKQAIVIEVETGRVLFDKNAQERMPTSSMSKVMTMYLVFEALEKGAIKLDQSVKISRKAFNEKGSRMFLKEAQRVKVEDLIRGVVVQSGNDAALALAEAVAGSEASFALAMNEKAVQLGLKNSHFVNASGLPDSEHYSTAHDLALVAMALMRDFPQYYHYYSEKSFTFNGITQHNRNPLLYRDMGVDGVKTGHTDAAGFGLIASAQRGARRILVVVNGLKDTQARAQEPANLIEWAFTEYNTFIIVTKGDAIGDAPVWLGIKPSVPVAATQDIAMTLSHDEREKIRIEKLIETEIEAPAIKGQNVGKIVAISPNIEPQESPLVVMESVERLGWFKAMIARVKRKLSL